MKIRDITITTDKRFISLDLLNQEARIKNSNYQKVDDSNLFETSLQFRTQTISINKEEPLKAELSDFLSSIKDSRQPKVSGEDGLLAVEIVEAGLLSLKNNEQIKLNV